MEKIQLSLTDLSDAVKIIGASIERGAFKADEVFGVATVYEKLKAYLVQEQEEYNNAGTSDSEGA